MNKNTITITSILNNIEKSLLKLDDKLNELYTKLEAVITPETNERPSVCNESKNTEPLSPMGNKLVTIYEVLTKIILNLDDKIKKIDI